MNAIRDAIAWLRRMQWKRIEGTLQSPGTSYERRGCGTVCSDYPVFFGDGEVTTRAGHACAFTRMLDDAEQEARAA